MKTLICTFALLGSSMACASQDSLDVGDEAATLGQALEDYAAEWDGYAEAFEFPGDGEDRVRMTLDENGAGRIRFGEEALFPTASDPNAFYPPTFSDMRRGDSLTGMRTGFSFAVSNATVSGARLQLQIRLGQEMESWCALQTREPVPGFECGGNTGYALEQGSQLCFTGNDGTPIDCEVADQCRNCQCDEQECHAREGVSLELDSALTNDGNTLEGTLLTDAGDRVTMRMVRSAE